MSEIYGFVICRLSLDFRGPKITASWLAKAVGRFDWVYHFVGKL